MTTSSKRWEFFEGNETHEHSSLVEALSVSPILAKLLIQRNIRTPEQAERFLNPLPEHCYDPFRMKDMDRVTERIRRAIASNERILVYGDYDVDGVTSTALACSLLKDLGASVDAYIPDRFTEGYGLNIPAIRKAHEQGYSLLVTVDNGISAVEQCKVAKELGIDVIVTDHHQPPDVLPDAYAILNPKQPGCEYPDKMLAGAGIAFKLAQALLHSFPVQYLDLAALGTIADLAPLQDENRVIAFYGLQELNRRVRTGVKALLDVAGLAEQDVTAGHIGFALGPRINASGRLQSAMFALELLMTDDARRAAELANELNEVNQERQDLCEDIAKQAIAMIEANPSWLEQRVLVVAGHDWNVGVVGIVASRLVERYYKPTVVLSISEHEAKGSARSVDGFDLYQALKACDDLFDHFGGHMMAAGLSLPPDQVDVFRERFAKAAADVWQAEWSNPKLRVDLSLHLADTSLDLLDAVAKMEPYGVGNPKPKFHLPSLQIDQVRAVGREKNHLQFRLSDGKLQIAGIAFKRGEELAAVEQIKVLDVVGDLELNEWNGTKSVQILIQDWKQSQPSTYTVMKERMQAIRETAATSTQSHDSNSKWQLEDLRDEVEIYGLQNRVDEILSKHQRANVVIFHKGMYLYHRHTFERFDSNSLRVWMMSQTGEKSFLLGEERTDGPVILVDYPFSLTQLKETLKEFIPSVIYLVQGMDAQEILIKQCERWLPSREQFAFVYRTLFQHKSMPSMSLLEEWQEQEDPGTANEHALAIILHVFSELGFVTIQGETVTVIPNVPKRQLTEAEAYQKRLHKVHEYQNVIKTLNERKGVSLWT